MNSTNRVVRTTLVFLLREGEILLGYKKRGFGSGRWNGFGGKIEQNETVAEAACREMKEESTIDVHESNLERVGLLQFEFLGEDLWIEVNVFRANDFRGNALETEEMRPKWFLFSDVPFAEMWPDDVLWFPYLFSNETFWGKFMFKGRTEIVDYDLQEIPSMKDLDALRW